jgi:hypothetical protein
MTDGSEKAVWATPPKDLEDRVMNPMHAKTEGEHWAKEKIETQNLLIKQQIAMIAHMGKQIFDLKAGLNTISVQLTSTEWEEEGDTQHGYDTIIKVARKTLKEIE